MPCKDRPHPCPWMHLHLKARRTSPSTSISASLPESQMQIEGENLLTAESWSFFHSLFKMDICSDSIKCLYPFPAVELCKLHLLYINKRYHRDSVFFFYETPEEISGNIKVLILIGGLWWLMMAKNILFFFFCIHWNKDLWNDTIAEFVILGSAPTTASLRLGKGLSLGRKERGNKERWCDLFCFLTSFFSKGLTRLHSPHLPKFVDNSPFQFEILNMPDLLMSRCR